MAKLIDTAIALRVLYILVTPIESTEAFKLGLIDSSGKTIRKAKTDEEKNSTSMLHRMCWNLKRIINLVPGGSTRIGSLVAGWALMKEAYEQDWSQDKLTEEAVIRFATLCESYNPIFDSLIEEMLDLLDEDAPTNATGAPVSTDVPMKIGNVARRKKFKTIDLPV